MQILKYKKIMLTSLGVISGLTLASPLVMYGVNEISKNKNTKDFSSAPTNMNFAGATRAVETKKVNPNEILNSVWYDKEFVEYVNIPKTRTETIRVDGDDREWEIQCLISGSGASKCSIKKPTIRGNSSNVGSYNIPSKLLKLVSPTQNYVTQLLSQGFINSPINIHNVNKNKNSITFNTSDVVLWANPNQGHTTIEGQCPGGVGHNCRGHTTYAHNPSSSMQAFALGNKIYSIEQQNGNQKSYQNINTNIQIFSDSEYKLSELDHYSNTEFNLNKLLMVDYDESYQTFETNNLKIKPNNDYLKSLIFMSNNIKRANELVHASTIQERTDEQWNAIINALVQGKIIDAKEPIFKKLGINPFDFGGFESTLDYLLNKYSAGYDVINDIENISNNKYMNYANENNIAVVDPYLGYKLENLLFKNVNDSYYDAFKFEIEFNYSGNIFSKQPSLVFDPLTKEFKLMNEKNEFNLVKEEGRGTNQDFLINKISIIGSHQDIAMMQENNLGILYKNKIQKPSTSDALSVKHRFDPTKLIEFKKTWSLNELAEVKGSPLTKQEIEKPSLLFKQEEFKDTLLSFKDYNPNTGKVYSWNEAPLKIVDGIIENEAKSVFGNSLLNNKALQKYFDDFQLYAFDSVNGIELDLNYKNIDRLGNVASKSRASIGNSLEKIVRFQTLDTTGNSFQNAVKTPTITNYDYDESKTMEENVLENLISYNGENRSNVLLKTTASYIDWNKNSYVVMERMNEVDNGIEGTIIYKDVADAKAWLNLEDKNTGKNVLKTTEQQLNFNISFVGSNDLIGGINDQIKKSSIDMWIILGSSLGGLVIIIALISYFIINKRKKLNKYKGEDLADLDEDSY